MTALHWAAHLDDLETAKAVGQGEGQCKRNEPLRRDAPLAGLREWKHRIGRVAAPWLARTRTQLLRGGETVLMTAARTGKVGPVKALLSRGAIVDAKERRGQTALMWAAADGHAAVVELLLKAGADFRTPLPDSGFTPLFFAAREGRTEVVRALLLKAGADVNDTMQPRKPSGKGPRTKGTSALILAVENGHFELALALLEAGADPNDQRSGFTPLHVMTWVRKPIAATATTETRLPLGPEI